MRRLRQFVWKNIWIVLALAALVVGLLLQPPKQYTAAAWVLGTVAIIEAAWLLKDVFEELRAGSVHFNLLAPIAIVSAVIFDDSWAALGVVLVVLFSNLLYAKTIGRTQKFMQSRHTHLPEQVAMRRGRKLVSVLLDDLHPGNKFVVEPGQIVAVDAVIIAGDSVFDTSSVTGSEATVTKKVGDELASGFINQGSAVTVKTLRTSSASQYQRITEELEIALRSHNRLGRLADRYSLPLSLLVLLIAGAAWYLGHDSQRFVAVLVGATPCTLLWPVLPAMQHGLLRLARHGIVLRSSRALENLADSETLAFSTADDSTAEALERLKAYGLKRSLLITDQPAAAGRVFAKKIGVTKLYAEAESHERLQILESVTERPLAFVGDGPGDRPAMSAADVSIVLGTPEAPLTNADVTTLTPSFVQLPLAVAIAQRTFKTATRTMLATTLFSLLTLALLATGWLSPLEAVSLQAATLALVLLAISFRTNN